MPLFLSVENIKAHYFKLLILRIVKSLMFCSFVNFMLFLHLTLCWLSLFHIDWNFIIFHDFPFKHIVILFFI